LKRSFPIFHQQKICHAYMEKSGIDIDEIKPFVAEERKSKWVPRFV
jgi:hypothetical protein